MSGNTEDCSLLCQSFFCTFHLCIGRFRKGKSKFLLLSSRHNTYKHSWESYSFIVIYVHKPEHIFFFKGSLWKTKEWKKIWRFPLKIIWPWVKIEKKVISMSNEGMNEVIIETQTYFFFPITELIRSPENSLMLERWRGPPAVVFFKFVCWFSHENEAGIYLFRQKNYNNNNQSTKIFLFWIKCLPENYVVRL